MTLPTRTALRYLQPLREGGSLPAVVDTDDGMYVVKFRGAGQGPRALIAELVVGLIAAKLGLSVPELAIVDVPAGFGGGERDPEIRDLLAASHGTNVALRYLDGAFNYDARAAGALISPDLAASVVWLDSLVTNPDRTARNPNLLVWDRRPWLIDHGSALYVHHAWAKADDARTRTHFPQIRDHVLLLESGDLDAVDARAVERLTEECFISVLEAVPDSLLMDPLAGGDFSSGDEARDRYVRYLETRLARSTGDRPWVAEAKRAREERIGEPQRRLEVRR